VAAFVRAGRVLWSEDGRMPVLLGTASEGHLAREFLEEADYPCVDLTGQTDLQTLAAVLTRMDLLLTNDTGTMHLAAGLGVPVAAVFLATAQPFDTGPYLEGSLSLEPDLPCHPCSFGSEMPPWSGLPRCHRRRCRGPPCWPDIWMRNGHWSVPEGLGPESGRPNATTRDSWIFFPCPVMTSRTAAAGFGFSVRCIVNFLTSGGSQNCLDNRRGERLGSGPANDLERAALMLTLVEEQGRVLALRPDAPMKPNFSSTVRI
jgi:hypothetical protein